MRLLSILIILITSLTSTSIQSKQLHHNVTQYMYTGIIIMSCNNLKSVQKVAAADKVSIQLARDVLQQEALKGNCGLHRPPLLVHLEKKIESYKDYANSSVSIWKLASSNMWSIFADNKVLESPINPVPKQTKGVEA